VLLPASPKLRLRVNWASAVRRSIGMPREQGIEAQPSEGYALPVRERKGRCPWALCYLGSPHQTSKIVRLYVGFVADR